MNQDSIFKAYDIRGKYPSEINEEIAGEIVAQFLTNNRRPTTNNIAVIIGHDARLSSPKIYSSLINSLKIKNFKLKIISIGLSTTPELYFLVNKYEADFGIMITASHNPKEYNGIKMVGKNAKPISGKEIYKIISNS
jgi:phosphomannomutase